jgi:mono/diheme cytochrome c family protein
LRIEIAAALLLSLGGFAIAAADARQDYILNCMGCHLDDGAGAPPAIPRLKDRVGYFLTIPQGRAYLAQVPGAANSLLDDARLTAVLNWIVAEYAGPSRPADWKPYEVAEVAGYRKNRPPDVDALRHTLTETIAASYPDARKW